MATTEETICGIFNDYWPEKVLKPDQKDVLTYLAHAPDKDVIVSWPTGAGKSVISHLSGKVYSKFSTEKRNFGKNITIIVVPLNLIQDDQSAALNRRDIRSCVLKVKGQAVSRELDDDDSGKSIDTVAKFQDIVDGKFEVVLAHPEALLSTEFGERLLSSSAFIDKVNCLIVDECHTVDQWADNFRQAFGQLCTLPGILECPVIALSATITPENLRKLPGALGMRDPKIFRKSPDNPNLFYDIRKKPANLGKPDKFATQEYVYLKELESLREKGENYPVTLLYMPMDWIANAQATLLEEEYFGNSPDMEVVPYSIIYSDQDEEVRAHIAEELWKVNPHIRLVMCSGTIGMGFDSPSVERIIHGKPPRSLVDYLQQVGRAGRQGQHSECILYYNNSDLGQKFVAQEFRDICSGQKCVRETLLNVFGFEKDVDAFSPACKCCYFCKKSCPHCALESDTDLDSP